MANGNFSQEINLEKEGFHNVLINYDDVAKTKTNFGDDRFPSGRDR